MSKLEEIRESMEYFSKPVGLWDTAELVKHKQPLINLARLILDASEVMPQKKVKSSHMLLSGKYEEVCGCAFKAYNQAISEVRPIVARKDLEIKSLKEKVAGAREALAHIRDILGQPPDRISDITIGAYADIRQRVLDVTTKFLEGV